MQEIIFGNIDELYKRIGKNVAKIRKEKKTSQLDLALAMGLKSVGLISVAEIYHNKKHFNIEHLDKIATILEVDICEFFKH
ncbi:MAG: helix-turn-helix transcriptional regulator [Sulfurospirillaceae bacterium]|nr:helix-turn-helix transcriptional regulator [Sulfurospirillaceae bacterium]MDD2826800.1 helix-turn-helix transcriptional regulator [Sulfurospirillaceae bacterium]